MPLEKPSASACCLPLWAAFVVLNLLDTWSTAMNVAQYGLSVEANPLIRPLLADGGAGSLLVYKLSLVVLLTMPGVRERFTAPMLWLLNLALLAVVVGNLFWH